MEGSQEVCAICVDHEHRWSSHAYSAAIPYQLAVILDPPQRGQRHLVPSGSAATLAAPRSLTSSL
eukprot:352744-Chlamydomonas_euryale.AAC.1